MDGCGVFDAEADGPHRDFAVIPNTLRPLAISPGIDTFHLQSCTSSQPYRRRQGYLCNSVLQAYFAIQRIIRMIQTRWMHKSTFGVSSSLYRTIRPRTCPQAEQFFQHHQSLWMRLGGLWLDGYSLLFAGQVCRIPVSDSYPSSALLRHGYCGGGVLHRRQLEAQQDEGSRLQPRVHRWVRCECC